MDGVSPTLADLAGRDARIAELEAALGEILREVGTSTKTNKIACAALRRDTRIEGPMANPEFHKIPVSCEEAGQHYWRRMRKILHMDPAPDSTDAVIVTSREWDECSLCGKKEAIFVWGFPQEEADETRNALTVERMREILLLVQRLGLPDPMCERCHIRSVERYVILDDKAEHLCAKCFEAGHVDA